MVTRDFYKSPESAFLFRLSRIAFGSSSYDFNLALLGVFAFSISVFVFVVDLVIMFTAAHSIVAVIGGNFVTILKLILKSKISPEAQLTRKASQGCRMQYRL